MAAKGGGLSSAAPWQLAPIAVMAGLDPAIHVLAVRLICAANPDWRDPYEEFNA